MGALKMKSINLILQAKNDVGKTYIASILTEYFQSKGSKICAYDTENSKNSLAKFSGLKVEPVELLDKNPAACQMEFGKFFDMAIAKNEGAVVDTGANIFEPIVQYFVKNWDDDLVAENTKEIIFHTVIAGGDRLDDTINGLVTLCNKLPPKVKIVVWLNEFFGPIAVDGKPFEEFKIYENNREKIHGIIKIPEPNSDFFKADLLKKNALKMTFEEGIKSEEFYLISKQRLKMIQREIFDQLDQILLPTKELDYKQNAQDIAKNFDGKSQPQTLEKEMPTFDNILNEEAIAKFDAVVKAIFENHVKRLETMNALHLSEASNRAEIVVTQAAEYLTNQMQQAADGIAASTSSMLAAQIDAANKAAVEAKKARNWSIFAASGSLIVVACAIIGKFF